MIPASPYGSAEKATARAQSISKNKDSIDYGLKPIPFWAGHVKYSFRKDSLKNPIPLPARNGVSFYPGHRPPFGLEVNGYLMEDYELRGIIAN